MVNKSVNFWTCQSVPRPQNTFCCSGGYNFLTSTFKIDFKKGLDSEDADRRDSINHLIFSSFCQNIINRFFLCQIARPKKMQFPSMNMYMLNCTLKFQSFACMRLLLGAKHVYGSVGCKVCGSWVQVYGYFWVHVYAFWVHVYGSVGCMPDCR